MLDAITGNAAIESKALHVLQEHATPVRSASTHETPLGWSTMVDRQSAPHGAGQTTVSPASQPFPSKLNAQAMLAKDYGTSYRRRVLDVPQRTVHRLDPPSLDLVRRLMTACEGAAVPEEASPVLDRGRRLIFKVDDGEGDPFSARYEARIDHRWGQVRACTVVDRRADTAPLVVLFDPHPPLVWTPQDKSLDSAAFSARLPNELWLFIRDQLDVRSQKAMREVGTSMVQLFRSADQIAAAGVKQLATELQTGEIILTIRELKQIGEALEHPTISAAQRDKLLEPLEPTIEAFLDVQGKGIGVGGFNRITLHWPMPVKAYIERIRREHGLDPGP